MAAMLRKIPGFEKYDENVHCLECIKPGTGSKDAPRAFSIKLARVTRDVKLGLVPTTYDPELEVKHVSINGRRTIVLMVAKHVDDLKVAGTRAEVDLLLRQLELAFGKLTVTYDEFTNCGVRHRRQKDGSILLDQDDYIKALIPIVHRDIIGRKPDEPVTEHVHSL